MRSLPADHHAVLVLEDGTPFFGKSSGIEGVACGEVVFNTSTTGYQEICTDPSYEGQIVVFSSPHIGNVGTNAEDMESSRVTLKGVVVLEMSKTASNWRNTQSFMGFLQEHGTVWIDGVDTRRLVRYLRETGAQSGCIMVGQIDVDKAAKLAKQHRLPELSYQRSTKPVLHDHSTRKIAVYDFGIKESIIRKLKTLGCAVDIFPCTHTANDILSLKPNGILISNGPGDPAVLTHGIQQTKMLIASGLPIFGICLGCQLIALACGGRTKKMKYGHHGTNHPVYDVETQRVSITSQNHNYTIDPFTLPSDLSITHRSLFDGSVQGIRLLGRPVFGFQGHPEGSPGPEDIDGLFEEFVKNAS